MTQKDNILQELGELNSTLANLTLQNAYTVPTGYFDELAGRMLNRIKAIEAKNAEEELDYLSPMLSKISKQMPYAVPGGYFEGLGETLLASVSEGKDHPTAKEELATLSPLLNGLKKEMPYSVPEGYFENLAGKISVEEKNKPVVKVVSITSRKWFRYAAAAVITGVIVMAGFLYFNLNGSNEPGGKALAKFTRDVKKMDETQKENLIEYIDGGLNPKQEFVAANSEKVNTEKKNEIKELLQGISDEELQNFQEQTEDIEDVLMTN